MAPRAWMPAAALGLVLLASQAAAYPYYFLDLKAPGDCRAYPLQAYGFHQAPIAEPAVGGTTFVVTDVATGQAVPTGGKLCPGKTYSLQFTYPQFRQGLLVGSDGTVFASPSRTNCPNRRLTGGLSDTQRFTLSCSAKGEWELVSTSATGATAAYQRATLTYDIDDSCADASCPSAASPPPRRQRKPPRPPPRRRRPPPRPRRRRPPPRARKPPRPPPRRRRPPPRRSKRRRPPPKP